MAVRPVDRDVLLDVLLPAALVAFAALFGYVLVSVASRFGTLAPVAVIAIPVLPAVALAVFNDVRLAPAAVIATFPFGTAEVPGVPLQLVQMAVLGVAVLVMLRRLSAGQTLLPLSPLSALAAAFCVWLVVALPSALDRQRALRDVVLFAIGLAAASLVMAACRRVRDVAWVAGVLLTVVAVGTAPTPLRAGSLRAAYGGAVVEGRAEGIFTQPNQLGTFAATGALIGVGLFFHASTRRGRWAAALATATSVVALLLSLSRGAWIGFTLGLLVLVFKLPQARRALVLVGVPVVALAFALGSFAPTSPQVEIVGQRLQSIAGERSPYDDRPAIWAEAWREIQLDPVTGQGPGSFPVASTRATSESRTTFADHAHNLVLTWGAEDGLPAVALAVVLGAVLHVRLRRVARVVPRAAALAAGVAAALVAVAGQGLVDYTLRNAVILTTLFVVLGLAFALDRLASE